MKKQIFILLIAVSLILLSSCGLFDCRHKYDERVVAPTCEADGYTEYTCTKCDDSYCGNETSKLGHSYSEKVVAPTCTAEGYTEHKCQNCGNIYNDTPVGITAHRFNGGNCVSCSKPEITESITADTEWYSAEQVIFTINTKEQLAGLASLVNSGTDFTNQKIYLDADLDLECYEWIPIGTAEYAFSGSFMGEGHIISNLKINAQSDYIGLFGKVSGSISDLTVHNASVYAKNDHSYVSIVCGYSANAILSVNVTGGFIDAEKSNYVGAIAGETASQIEKCSNSAEINGADHVGGLVGSSNVVSAVFSSLINSGAVKGNNCVGGLVGIIKGSGSVQTDILSNTGSVTGAYRVGGIFGHISAKVGSAVYGASVSADIVGEYYVGGIVGSAVNVAVSTCSNEGSTVMATSYLTEGEYFYVFLGGYVGEGYSVDNCVNNVEINYNSRGLFVGGIAGHLNSSASNCENNGKITGYSHVGGIAGKIYPTVGTTLSSLKNNGNVSGNDHIGGVVGLYYSNADTTLSQLENSGAISASDSVAAGIIASCYSENASAAITAANLVNKGDVTVAKSHIGGLFGYIAGSMSSIIKNSSSSANIKGGYRVGGLVGDGVNVTVKDCSNEGSTITATGWLTNEDIDYVWLGGYVGCGYKVIGCINNSDITYDGTGIYVGGIIGYASADIQNCTNNGNITTNVNCVGGIAGEVNSPNGRTFSNLTNTGNISGNGKVAGIIGALIQITDQNGSWYKDSKIGSCVGDPYYDHYYHFVTNISMLTNSGNVDANWEVGGIIGYAHFISNYYLDKTDCHSGCSVWGHRCRHHGEFIINSNVISNTSSISGNSQTGELFGYFYSDAISTLNNYTVTGSITVNNELKEGAFDIGGNTNLTLSGRELYTPEATEGDEANVEE